MNNICICQRKQSSQRSVKVRYWTYYLKVTCEGNKSRHSGRCLRETSDTKPGDSEAGTVSKVPIP